MRIKVSLALEEDLINRLDTKSAALNVSRSEVANRLLLDSLATEELTEQLCQSDVGHDVAEQMRLMLLDGLNKLSSVNVKPKTGKKK